MRTLSFTLKALLNTIWIDLGDSGGPLLQLNYFDNDFKKGRASSDLLVGITSYGSLVTDRYIPGVYTSISYFALWIDCIIDGQVSKQKFYISGIAKLWMLQVRLYADLVVLQENCTEATSSSPASNDGNAQPQHILKTGSFSA